MEKENTNVKNQKGKKIFFGILAGILLILCATGAYFMFRYLFPSEKELLIMANIKTYNEYRNVEKVKTFAKDTNISFKTEGDFTHQRAAKNFESFKINLHNVNINENNGRYDVGIDFAGKRLFNSSMFKNDITEIFYAPQLAERAYSSKSYSDVLSLLVGSERPQEIGYLENLDMDGFKKYYGKYLKRLYENIPDNDFSVSENSDVKTLILKTDLNRLLYDIISEVKSDNELREFSYNQRNIIYDNINKKIPYVGTLLTAEGREEYDEKFTENIEKIIEDMEDSILTITAEIDKDRKIIKETVEIKNDKEIQLYILYSADNIEIINNDEGKLVYRLAVNRKTENEKVYTNLATTFDVNDFTKEKSQEQKLVTVISETVTDTSVKEKIEYPVDVADIRNMTDEEREKITQNASKKFMEMITTLTLELLM